MFHQPPAVDFSKEFQFLLNFYALASNLEQAYFSETVYKGLFAASEQGQGVAIQKMVELIQTARKRPRERRLDKPNDPTYNLHHAIANALSELLHRLPQYQAYLAGLKQQLKARDEDHAYLASRETSPTDLEKAQTDYEDTLKKLCALADKDSVRKAAERKVDFDYSPITCEEFFNTFLRDRIKKDYPEFKMTLANVQKSRGAMDTVINTKTALGYSDSPLKGLSDIFGFGKKR